jgi:hypothetical protein
MSKKTKVELQQELKDLGYDATDKKAQEICVAMRDHDGLPLHEALLFLYSELSIMGASYEYLHPLFIETLGGEMSVGNDWVLTAVPVGTITRTLEEFVRKLKADMKLVGVNEGDYLVLDLLALDRDSKDVSRPEYRCSVYRMLNTTKADFERVLDIVKVDGKSSSSPSEEQADDLVEKYKALHGADALADLIKYNL